MVTIHLDLSSNTQYVAKLSGTLLLPFTGWLTDKRFILTNSDNESVNIEKANFSDDSIFIHLDGSLTFKVQLLIPVERQQILATTKLALNKFNGIYKIVK